MPPGPEKNTCYIHVQLYIYNVQVCKHGPRLALIELILTQWGGGGGLLQPEEKQLWQHLHIRVGYIINMHD